MESIKQATVAICHIATGASAVLFLVSAFIIVAPLATTAFCFFGTIICAVATYSINN